MGRFTQPTQSQGGQGDPQLTSRKIRIKFSGNSKADFARWEPASDSSANRVLRTLTIENSAATKNPFKNTKNKAREL